MSDSKLVGHIEWRGLTAANAYQVSDFYAQVIGLQREQLSIGNY